MNFWEATEIAKINPGAVVTRNSEGDFVVLDERGDPLKPGEENATARDGGEKKEAALRRYEQLNERLSIRVGEEENRNKRLAKEVIELEGRLKELEQQLSDARRQLGRVSTEEWAAIESREKCQMEKERVERQNERRTVQCACLGEVEKCQMCYGKGYYEADGHGNPI